MTYVAVHHRDNLVHVDITAFIQPLSRLPESTCDIGGRLQKIGV
ncbi:hypothetical protein [Streptomyces sp. NRRL F-2580]|nr:hypothetical protein [Streptomyces sp. NRRL F-2580]